MRVKTWVLISMYSILGVSTFLVLDLLLGIMHHGKATVIEPNNFILTFEIILCLWGFCMFIFYLGGKVGEIIREEIKYKENEKEN